MMELLLPILWFVLGLVIIIRCGDLFVDASRWVSGVTGIPKVVIGATLVSFATTAPEFFVSMISTMQGSTALSTGNAIGSVVCNLGLPLAVLMICRPRKNKDGTVLRQGMIMMIATLIFFVAALRGTVTALDAILLYGVFGLFVFVNIYGAKSEKEKVPTNKADIGKHLLMFAIGLGGIIVSAQLMVNNAKIIASYFGVSEAIIGLTVVAIGTSLPEIVTTLTSLKKKENSIAFGNIIGANIVNITLIMSTTALASLAVLPVEPRTAFVDIPVALAMMAVLLFPTAVTKRFSRWQGAVMLALYCGYMVSMFL